jgi:hypothetical protein
VWPLGFAQPVATRDSKEEKFHEDFASGKQNLGRADNFVERNGGKKEMFLTSRRQEGDSALLE